MIFSTCKKQEETVSSQEISDWKFEYQGDWHQAEVPGNNFSDLLKYDFIPDPFYGINEDSIQWVSERKWQYKSHFSAPKNILKNKNQLLVFSGLDTYAKVYLNDSLILQANNMFRTWEVDISDILKKENTLLIKFDAVSKIENEKQIDLGYNLPGGNRVFTRKAGFHYGWDWGAKISPTGIWRKIELQSWSDFKIKDVHIVQDHLTDTLANLTIGIEIESSVEKLVTLKAYDKVWENFKLKKGSNKLSFIIHIPTPELWWPNGYGEQKLYDINISISDEKRLLDSQTKKIGLRKIELITKQDSIGESFYFKVNDKPIFMKGANYIPQDNLQNRVTKNHYRNLLNDAVKANMNMLRVWGGGIYEEDIFYDLCDSLGILVWQDFMFACAMYPSDSLFLENVKKEAIQNIKRLRHHPSIALWCGNNENSEGWHRWGWQNAFPQKLQNKIWHGYQKVFQEMLPTIVAENSHSAYWESSPKFGRGNPKHQFEGDAHYWGVWHDAEPFENLETKVPRFMSEFGFQSFPQISTIATFADSLNWDLNSAVMQKHQKHPRGNSLITEYMTREFNVQKDFRKFVYASQILQANGMRIGLESHRRNQPYCMGTLYWQLNDCWPVASWSSRDYFGNWKALHYTAQDVFSPISLSQKLDRDGRISVWVMTDLAVEIQDTLIISIYNLDGEITHKVTDPISKKVKGSVLIYTQKIKAHDNQFIVAELKNKQVKSKTLFAAEIKSLNFKKPTISYQIENNTITLQADIPAFEVYLHGIEGQFSDNFFSLLPGEKKILKFEGEKLSKNKLLIWSLYDLNK